MSTTLTAQTIRPNIEQNTCTLVQAVLDNGYSFVHDSLNGEAAYWLGSSYTASIDIDGETRLTVVDAAGDELTFAEAATMIDAAERIAHMIERA